jgi:hypothetical protein
VEDLTLTKHISAARLHLRCSNNGTHRPRLLGSYSRYLKPDEPGDSSVMQTVATNPSNDGLYSRRCPSCERTWQWSRDDVNRMVLRLNTSMTVRCDLDELRRANIL